MSVDIVGRRGTLEPLLLDVSFSISRSWRLSPRFKVETQRCTSTNLDAIPAPKVIFRD